MKFMLSNTNSYDDIEIAFEKILHIQGNDATINKSANISTVYFSRFGNIPATLNTIIECLHNLTMIRIETTPHLKIRTKLSRNYDKLYILVSTDPKYCYIFDLLEARLPKDLFESLIPSFGLILSGSLKGEDITRELLLNIIREGESKDDDNRSRSVSEKDNE